MIGLGRGELGKFFVNDIDSEKGFVCGTQTGPLAIETGGICSKVVLDEVALKISAIKFFFLSMSG